MQRSLLNGVYAHYSVARSPFVEPRESEAPHILMSGVSGQLLQVVLYLHLFAQPVAIHQRDIDRSEE